MTGIRIVFINHDIHFFGLILPAVGDRICMDAMLVDVQSRGWIVQ